MLDNEFNIDTDFSATIVSIVAPNFKEHATEFETNRSLVELRELLRTLGIKVNSAQIQNKKEIDPATILGSGKIKEISELAHDEGSKLLVFDFELTARQNNNIREITGLSVVDRVHVIREKIEFYKEELAKLEIQRNERRKKRQNQAVTAALVGYTNAGKSSVMNRLCRVDILEENKLFATLDSTYRMLNPDTKPPMILIDTVGFISNLPNTLIDGFKTTLESALEADLLVIICDISDPHFEKHLEVTQTVLKELKVEDKEQLIVFNKADLFNDPLKKMLIKRKYPDSFMVSSYNEADMKELRKYIIDYFLKKQDHYDLFIPYEEGQAHSAIMSKTNVVSTQNHEKGIFYRIRVPDFIFGSLGLSKYILAPNDPLLDERDNPIF
jgi:50S ribosomal subunit-associated GTPase HflX